MNKISIVLFAFLICIAFTSGLQIVQGSTSAFTWTKYSGNPFNLGASDVTEPWVIYSGSVFKMWYVGVASYNPFMCRIYYAVSIDGVNWAPQGVILSEGEAGSWDDRVVSSPVVLFDGTTYRMWYIGVGGSASVYGMVGYATSSDGTSWTKHEGGPVLIPGGNGGWDDYNVGGLSVMFNGTHYMMCYGGQPGVDTQMRIGIATSVDGISWNKYPNNPILSPTSDWWEDRHVSPGPVIMNESHYIMSYSGQGGSWPGNRVGIATSPDGFSWTEYEGNPVLDVGQPGSWDERTVSAHSIVRKDDSLLMWYTGANYDPAGHYSGIGLATSYAPCMLAEFFLHGGASLDNNSPTAVTAKYMDSPSIKFGGGNPWKEIGTWAAPASLIDGRLDALGGLDVWLGLKNSDDQGTNFDLRAVVYKDGVLLASGETYLIKGVTRNPDKAMKVTVSFGSFSPVDFDGTTDRLSLKILARIGTDGHGNFGGGHSSAVGLRLYFDAVSRPAMLAASIA
jgi:hypothetical protein